MSNIARQHSIEPAGRKPGRDARRRAPGGRKGEATREAILDRALDLASVIGLEGISIGALARETSLSKSGLFAHFGSKERLQVEIMEEASERFLDKIVRPARRLRAGEPRIRALFEGWLEWVLASENRGGCLFVSSAIEFDDRPGPVRDYLVFIQEGWFDILARAASKAVEAGDFRADLDPRQFAHDFYSIALGCHHVARLLRDPQAEARARAAFEALIANAH